MAVAQLLVASAMYAVGGLFMKLSNGLTRPSPTIAFVILFLGGSLLQAAGMKTGDMGTSYVFVLGVEALTATTLSVVYLHEGYPPSRIGAVLLVIVGVIWLRRS